MSSRSGLWFALALACVLASLSAAGAHFAGIQLPASSPFLTIFLTLAASADALTGLLLLSQARVGRSISLMLLSSGYFYSSLAIVVHALVFPGVFAPGGLLGAGTQAAVWFWVWWHGGFPLFVIAYAIASPREDYGRHVEGRTWSLVAPFAAGVLAVVAFLMWVTLKHAHALPALIEKGNYGLLRSTGVGPAIMLSIACAIVAIVRFTRLRTVTDVWLAVALFASLLDCSLTLFAGGRFTVGWYVARLESLFASTIVLLAFLRGIDRILTRLALLTRIDGLTGLANRRAFDEELEAAIVANARADQPVSLLMLDVDHFKKYNDAYGHRGGDKALQLVANAINQSLARRSDVGARYGGEEFAIILPMTGLDGAMKVAERVRAAVVRSAMPHSGSASGIVSVSIGVGTLGSPLIRGEYAADILVERADAALYRAKRAGRNRVEADTSSLFSSVQPARDFAEDGDAELPLRRNRRKRATPRSASV
jgi:diguanylate cyclase (GGDEF)-like protein